MHIVVLVGILILIKYLSYLSETYFLFIQYYNIIYIYPQRHSIGVSFPVLSDIFVIRI